MYTYDSVAQSSLQGVHALVGSYSSPALPIHGELPGGAHTSDLAHSAFAGLISKRMLSGKATVVPNRTIALAVN